MGLEVVKPPGGGEHGYVWARIPSTCCLTAASLQARTFQLCNCGFSSDLLPVVFILTKNGRELCVYVCVQGHMGLAPVMCAQHSSPLR